MPDVQASADLMSPLHLFLQADAVVKAVMLGLLLASIWTWAIIFTHSIRLKRINRGTDKFEREFWATNDIDAFHRVRGEERLPIAAVMSAAMDEWRRSTKTAQVDRAGTRERLASRMNDTRHWFSDVAAGAVIGIVSAKVASGRWSIFGLRAPSVITGPRGVGLGWQAAF